MNPIQIFTVLALLQSTAMLSSADVPSLINYQGRLTNAAGVPQPGTKAMSVKIYNAATAGTQLYSETMGNVTVDANGVYGFQFGATGTSATLVSETIAITDGTSQTFQKTLSYTPVVAGSASVADGTYSWNETTGYPGAPATATSNVISGFVVGATITNGGSGYTVAPAVTITGNGNGAAATATISGGAVTAINITNAGSGYSTGATITIAPPVIPFQVTYAAGSITATYANPPSVGQTITATYRYSGSGISGALAAGGEQWLELTVGGVAQVPRQRVLAVPFAMHANSATTALTAGLNAAAENRIRTLEDSFLMRQLDDYAYRDFTKPNLAPGFIWESMTSATGKNGMVTSFSSPESYYASMFSPVVYSLADPTVTGSSNKGEVLAVVKSMQVNAKIGQAEARIYQGLPRSPYITSLASRIDFVFTDDTVSQVAVPNATNDPKTVVAFNPQPSKMVKRVDFRVTINSLGGGLGFDQCSCDNAKLSTVGTSSLVLTLPPQSSNWTKFHFAIAGSREDGDSISGLLSNATTSMSNLLPNQVYTWSGATAPTTLTLTMQPAPSGTPRATSITTVGIFQN